MTCGWEEISKAIRAGEHPFITRTPDTQPCFWQIRADPFSSKPFHDILVGHPCSNRTRWRFQASQSSSVDSGTYCWVHIKKIAESGIEVLRYQIWKGRDEE